MIDYEKAYKKALECATKAKNNASLSNGTLRVLEIIFPELKESEDERIRKEFCKDIWTYIPNEKAHKYIAWLEKQGEKKSKWTEEGEENMQHCCGAVAAADYYTMEDKEEMANWLISLKQRMEAEK